MSYTQNFLPANGGVYKDPITNAVVDYPICNYAPKNPCLRKDFYSTFSIESKPYNPEEVGAVSYLRRIAANSALPALDSAVTLDPAITTAQKQEVSADFYNALAGTY